jgi:hypothetical protein
MQLYEASTRFTLQKEIKSSLGSHLVEVRFDKTVPGKNIVRAVVRGPHPPSAAQVLALEAKLPIPPERKIVELRIRFVQTAIINRDGAHYMRTLSMEPLKSKALVVERYHSWASRYLRSRLILF